MPHLSGDVREARRAHCSAPPEHRVRKGLVDRSLDLDDSVLLSHVPPSIAFSLARSSSPTTTSGQAAAVAVTRDPTTGEPLLPGVPVVCVMRHMRHRRTRVQRTLLRQAARAPPCQMVGPGPAKLARFDVCNNPHHWLNPHLANTKWWSLWRRGGDWAGARRKKASPTGNEAWKGRRVI